MHEKKVKEGDIDIQTTRLTHQILMDGVTKGLKVDWSKVDYQSPNGEKLKALQTQVFKFSACKNYHEVAALSRALVDKQGRELSFEDFKKVASRITGTFNGNWLRTEYSQAQVTATRIADYSRMEDMKDIYPTWQYKTRADGHVREPHAALHNMKLASNDPAWDSIYPPNGWNCRCWVEPVSDDAPSLDKGQEAIGKLRSTVVNKKLGLSEWDMMVKQGFNQNPAKTDSVYPKNHPYFKSLQAVENILKSTPFTQEGAIKQQRVELKEWAKESLLPINVRHDFTQIKYPITFTISGIKEYLNQPHKNYWAKNESLRKIDKLIKESKYIRSDKDIRGRMFIYHYLQTMIEDEPSFIVIREDIKMKNAIVFSNVDSLK